MQESENPPQPRAKARGRPPRRTPGSLTLEAAATPTKEVILKRKIQTSTEKEQSKRRKSELAEINRNHELMLEAKGDGWESVTNLDAFLLPTSETPASGMRPRLRGDIEPVSLFFETWSSQLITCFLNASNFERFKDSVGNHPRKKGFTEGDIYSLTAICLKLMGTGARSMTNLWDGSPQYGSLGQNKYNKLRKYFNFPYGAAFEIFNRNQRGLVTVGSDVAIDESSWAYHGPTDFHVFLPRKPEPNMIRAYTAAMPLAITNRPYCVGVLPDIRRPTYSDAEILGWSKELLHGRDCFPVCDCLVQDGAGWTVDKFFGNLSHLESSPNQRLTMAISAKRLGAIGVIGKLGLKHQETRMFRKGNILLSVYADNKVLWTVSNCFGVKESLDPDLRYRGTNMSRNVPCLSEQAYQNLLGWQKGDLQSLAQRLGVSNSGKSKEVLAQKIALRASPLEVQQTLDFLVDIHHEAAPRPSAIPPPLADDAPLPPLAEPLQSLRKPTLDETVAKLSTLKKDVLKQHLANLHHGAAGNKPDLVHRLAKAMHNTKSSTQRTLEIEAFLGTPRKYREGSKPPLVAHYAATFNGVDRFDSLTSQISFKIRKGSENWRIFTALLQIAIVNAWILYVELLPSSPNPPPQLDLKQFVLTISNQVAARFKPN